MWASVWQTELDILIQIGHRELQIVRLGKIDLYGGIAKQFGLAPVGSKVGPWSPYTKYSIRDILFGQYCTQISPH